MYFEKVKEILTIFLAVVLLAPAMETVSETTEGQQSHRMNTQTDALHDIHDAFDKAEMPQSKSLNRHSVNRFMKRQALRAQRFRYRFKSAVMRILTGDSEYYNKDGSRKIQPETEAQCAECGCKETDSSPFVSAIGDTKIDPQCVDCVLDEYEPDYFKSGTEMPRSSPLSALLIGIFFVLLGSLIDPTMASSVALIGATRRKLPADMQKLKSMGYDVRRVAKNRDTQCHECGIALTHNGEYGMPQVYIERAGYEKKKPHCGDCALKLAGFDSEKGESEKKKQNGSEYNPKPNRYDGQCHICGTEVKAYEGRLNGKNVLCMKHKDCETKKGAHCIPCGHLVDDLGCGCNLDTETGSQSNDLSAEVEKAMSQKSSGKNDETGAQLIELIGKLTASGTDEETVRRIAREEDSTLISTLQATNSRAQEKIMKQIDEKIESMTVPLRLELKKTDCEPVEIEGVHHHKLPEILSDIVHCGAENLNLTGEAGTGKTFLIDQIHDILQAMGWFKKMGVKGERECFILSANKDMQAPELIGRESPIFFETEGFEAGEWAFIKGAILPNFEHGGVIGLDEMDRFADSTLSALNAALANGFITTPKGERILRHPASIIIATGNTKGQGASQKYSAANKQDSATLDRFAGHFIDIDYDPAIEDAVCGSQELANAIRTVRSLADQHQIKGAVFSYRCMIEARKMMQAGRSLAFVMHRICMAFGEDNAIKLGHGKEVKFDALQAWGEGGFTLDSATKGGA